MDASALCAILLDEADGRRFADAIETADRRWTSAITIYETVLALARVNDGDVVRARRSVQTLLDMADIDVVAIGTVEATVALDAHARFGKGRHPARLNMGDCFAYACARTNDAALLYKGGDFGRTDISRA